MSTKRQLINSILIPTLCYQCQTWTLNKTQERKIQTCEICLRKARQSEKYRHQKHHWNHRQNTQYSKEWSGLDILLGCNTANQQHKLTTTSAQDTRQGEDREKDGLIVSQKPASNMDYELERKPFSPMKENYISPRRLTAQVDGKSK